MEKRMETAFYLLICTGFSLVAAAIGVSMTGATLIFGSMVVFGLFNNILICSLFQSDPEYLEDTEALEGAQREIAQLKRLVRQDQLDIQRLQKENQDVNSQLSGLNHLWADTCASNLRLKNEQRELKNSLHRVRNQARENQNRVTASKSNVKEEPYPFELDFKVENLNALDIL